MAALSPLPPPPTRRALFALAGAILVQLTSTRLAVAWLVDDGSGDGMAAAEPVSFLLAFLVVPALLTLAWIWFATVWAEPAGWRGIGFVGRPADSLSLGVATGGGTVVLSIAIVAMLAPLLGEPRGPPLPVPLDEALGQPGFVVLFAFAAIVVAPLTEEVLFRGVLYGWLRQHLSWRLAALLAALVHALLHGDPAAMPALTAVFFVYAWSYERRGSLWTPLIAHATHNAIILVLSVTATQGASG